MSEESPQKEDDERKEVPVQIEPAQLEQIRMKSIDLPTKIRSSLRELELRMICHKMAFIDYKFWDKLFGYPLTLVSTFLASSFLIDLSRAKPESGKVMSSIGLVLSALSMFFSITRDYTQFGELSKSHEISYKLYQSLIRSVEVMLVCDSEITKEDYRRIFKHISDQLTQIEQYEQPVGEKIEQKVKKEYLSSHDIMDTLIITDAE